MCDTVASQLIGHDHSRHVLQALEQPFEESLRGLGIPPRLNEDVEYDAVLVHHTPEIMLDALDSNKHFIKVPFVTGARTTAAQAAGKALAEFLAPAPNGLIRDDNAPRSHQQLYISKAEAENAVQPDGVAKATPKNERVAWGCFPSYLREGDSGALWG